MDSDPDGHVDLDPDPIPNIVLHPGDTIQPRWDAAGQPIAYRLFDRSGQCYAVLDGDHYPNAAFIVHTIRFVSAPLRRRELLPVRPEPDPHGLTVYDAVPDTTDPTATISANYDTDGNPLPVRHLNTNVWPVGFWDRGKQAVTHGTTPIDALTVTHSHAHTHEYGGGGAGYTEQHTHDHTHPGFDAIAPGHAYASHLHDHPDEPAE